MYNFVILCMFIIRIVIFERFKSIDNRLGEYEKMLKLFKWKSKINNLEEKNSLLENELAAIRLKIQELELENEKLKQQNKQIQNDIDAKNKKSKLNTMIFKKLFNQCSKLEFNKEASK